ncbi:MAG: ferritin [Armatimonadota bacterium]
MPEFTNPFPGVVPRTMTHSELVRAIMLNIAAELEAVHLYTAHMDATDNADAKKVLFDIALEELVHAGEFTSLLYRLDPVSGQKAQEGFNEVEELLASQAPSEVVTAAEEEPLAAEPEPPIPTGLTVGNLIGTGM